VGHNIHFLERIERLNLRQADRALGLYRDPQAVAFLLQRFHLPDGVERVALALGGGEEPPHVVLTRSGQFVTCLGAGMATRDLHAVPFVQMERELNHLGALRETLDGQITRGGALARLKNLFHKSNGISREEFSSLLTLRPLLGRDLLRINATSWEEIERFRDRWQPHPKQRDTPAEAHALSLYWRALWASAHITTLLSADVPELEHIFGRLPPPVPAGTLLTWPLARSGVMGFILRGWHAAAMLGRTFLPVARHMLDEGMITENAALLTMGGLLAVRARNPDHAEAATRLLDEAQQILDAAEAADALIPEDALDIPDNDEDETPEGQPAVRERLQMRMATFLKGIVLALRQPTERPSERFLPALRQGVLKSFPADVFERPEDMGDDIAIATSLQLRTIYSFETLEPTRFLGHLLPIVTRLTPEQLYLPEHLLRHVVHPTNKVDLEFVRGHLHYVNPRTPREVRARPGRNAPCPCGSGKKYKACCAR
jgi:hypothetical protein